MTKEQQESADDTIDFFGKEKCVAAGFKYKGGNTNWVEANKRIHELELQDYMSIEGNDIKGAIKLKLVSSAKGYRDYPVK